MQPERLSASSLGSHHLAEPRFFWFCLIFVSFWPSLPPAGPFSTRHPDRRWRAARCCHLSLEECAAVTPCRQPDSCRPPCFLPLVLASSACRHVAPPRLVFAHTRYQTHGCGSGFAPPCCLPFARVTARTLLRHQTLARTSLSSCRQYYLFLRPRTYLETPRIYSGRPKSFLKSPLLFDSFTTPGSHSPIAYLANIPHHLCILPNDDIISLRPAARRASSGCIGLLEKKNKRPMQRENLQPSQ